MNLRHFFWIGILAFLVLFIISCNSTKFVKDDQYLLDKVTIDVDTKEINKENALSYVAQKPNYETFQIFKLPLFLYNLSGRNDSNFVSRTLRNAGEQPVIFDSLVIGKTESSLYQMAFNKGFFDTKIETQIKYKPKKVDLKYIIETFDPYVVDSFSINVPDSLLKTRFFANIWYQTPEQIIEYR